MKAAAILFVGALLLAAGMVTGYTLGHHDYERLLADGCRTHEECLAIYGEDQPQDFQPVQI